MIKPHENIVPQGLHNLGNTCFLNACMQSMLACKELTAILQKITRIRATDDANIYREYADLQRLVCEGNAPGRSISPNRFVYFVQQVAMKKGRELFTGWAQNDMSEFLIFVFDCMHTAISRKTSMRIEGQPKNPTDQLAVDTYTMLKEVYSREYSEMMETFYGVYITTIRHNTHIEAQQPLAQAKQPLAQAKQPLATKPEHFFVLDLPIMCDAVNFTDLYECFDAFVAPERLHGDNAYFDEKSGTKIDAEKCTTFWSLPQVLVITLNRFSRNKKLRHPIQFPINDPLDLSKYVVGYRSNNRYELFAVCNHMGNMMGGHYTAHVKYGKTWYLCNDAHVEQNDSISYSDAYCLFFRGTDGFSAPP